MFSGIVQEMAPVRRALTQGTGRIVQIEKPRGWRLKKGHSVSVNGVCSTVRALGATHFEVEYMPLTLAKTTAGALAKGDIVNLEKSLRVGDALDGHFVQGHVDARASVVRVRTHGASRELTLRVPKALMHFIARSGSVAINGVSLTVAARTNDTATVALVSYTLAHTNLGFLKKGDAVNIETDLIARHLAQLRER